MKVRVSTLLALYGWRLRRHKVQELLAGIGIVVGVALFFGVLVANKYNQLGVPANSCCDRVRASAACRPVIGWL